MAEKIRIGVVGAKVKGTWSARAHLPALRSHPDFELTDWRLTEIPVAEWRGLLFIAIEPKVTLEEQLADLVGEHEWRNLRRNEQRNVDATTRSDRKKGATDAFDQLG